MKIWMKKTAYQRLLLFMKALKRKTVKQIISQTEKLYRACLRINQAKKLRTKTNRVILALMTQIKRDLKSSSIMMKVAYLLTLQILSKI